MILDNLFKIPKTADIDKLVKSYKNLNIEQAIAKMRTDEIADAEIRATLSKRGYTEADIAQAMATSTSNTLKAQNIALTKLQTIGHYALAAAAKVAKIAISGIVGAVVSVIATKFISWITNIIGKQEDLAEAADKAKANLDELIDTLNTKKSTVKEVAEEYAKLAQGVNQLTGENVSLSTEDYERFLDLSNQLSEQFPELTRKYDENGNAILDLTGNVDGIVGSLQELIKVQQRLNNQELSSNMSTVYEDYYEKTKDLKDKIEKENKKQTQLDEAKETLLNSPRVFTPLQNSERAKVENAAKTFGLNYTTNEITDAKGKTAFVIDIEGVVTSENVLSKYNELYKQSIINLESYKDQLAVKENEINKYLIACLQPDLDIYNFGENDSTIKAVIEKLFTNFDPSTLPDYIDASDWNEVYAYLRQIYLYPISKLEGDVQQKLADVFNKPDDMSNQEYIQMANELQAYFDANHIAINLDFIVQDERDVERRFNNKINELTKDDPKGAKKLNRYIKKESIDTSEEKEYFLTITREAETATEAIDKLNDAKEKMDKWSEINLEPIHEDLDSIRDAYQKVSDAIDEYEEHSYLSLETVQELIKLDDKYLTCLYDEEGQLTLNTQAYNNLTRAKLEEMKVGIINNALDIVESLDSEEQAVNYLKDANIDLTNVNWDLFESNIALAESELALLSDTEAVEQRQKALDQIAESTKARIALIQEAMNSVGQGQNRPYFYTGGSGSKDTDKDKDSPTEIDWAEQSLKVLESEVDKFQDVLDNAHGYDNQINAINDLNTALGKLKTGYESVREEYSTRYKSNIAKLPNGDIIRNYIESGKKFDLSKYDSDTAEIIKNAIDAYNDMIEAEKKIKELTDQISDNDNLEKSKLLQQTYESQLDVINTKLEDQTLSADEKNRLLNRQLKLQIAINEELRKQAKYEGDYDTISKLDTEDKNKKLQTRLNQLQNKKDQNQVYINTYESALEDTNLTSDDINGLNTGLESFVNRDFKYQFKEKITALGETWTDYIASLKKKHSEQDMNDKKFIKKHLGEISKYFSYTGMEELYYEYLNSGRSFEQTDYDTEKNERSYYINENNNKLANIQSDIEYTGGRGTKEQYLEMQNLHQSNLEYWTEQKQAAEEMRKQFDKGTAGWDQWNSEIQECDNNINECYKSIKDCDISILQLPLNDVEDALRDIENKLRDINKEIDDQSELISAAIAILDNEIDTQEILKEAVQDKIDKLEKENKLRESNLNIQKAEYELEKLKNQKTEKVFKEGQGWVYESNADEIRDAQYNLDNAKYEHKLTLLNDHIEVYDEEIKRLNKIKKRWTDINTEAERLVLINKALLYDSGFVGKVLGEDSNFMVGISSVYSSLLGQKDTYEDQQEDYTTLQDIINDTVEMYDLEAIGYIEAKQRIKNAIVQYYPEIVSKYENEEEVLDRVAKKKLEDAGVTETTSESINETVKKSNKKLLKNYKKLAEGLDEVFDQLNGLLNEYSSNTQTMVNTISASIESLRSQLASVQSDVGDVTITTETTTTPVESSGTKKKKKKKKKVEGAGKSHSGLELGYLGDGTESGDKKAFRYIALDEMDNNEMLRLVQKGEAILTPNQVSTVMSNFRNLAEVKLPTFIPNKAQSNSVSFNGDIVINNPIGDTQKLAKEISKNFSSTLLQEIYK